MSSIIQSKQVLRLFLALTIFIFIREINSLEQSVSLSLKDNRNFDEKKFSLNNQDMMALNDPSKKDHQNIRSSLKKLNGESDLSKPKIIPGQKYKLQSTRMLEDANEEAEEGEEDAEDGEEQADEEEGEADENEDEEGKEEEEENVDEEEDEGEDEEQNQVDDLADYFDDGFVYDESTDDVSIQEKIENARDKAADDIDYLFKNDPRTWSVYHWLLAFGSFLLFFLVFYCSCRCLQSCCSRSKPPAKEEAEPNSNVPYEAMA